MRKLYLAGLLFVVLSGGIGLNRSAPDLVPSLRYSHPTVRQVTAGGEAAGWFRAVRPFCNAVEVETRQQAMPPPAGPEGAAYGAACFALAGRIERARQLIQQLEGDERWRAAGVVFNVAHPVADEGDDRSAGPIMELVVEFWPNHYMALYHAGMARFGLGDAVQAGAYLTRFLENYDPDDGWTRSAEAALEDLRSR